MTKQNEIVIVSGLPRSGTSLMMQMLQRGGIDVVTDKQRVADDDNPRGYLEYEPVKKLKQDATWLPAIRGKAVKLISQLLTDLPASERYAIIWMDRDLDEILASQDKMLRHLGRPAADANLLREGFKRHFVQMESWFSGRADIRKLSIAYSSVIASPSVEATKINKFLGDRLDVGVMCSAVDPALYRNRRDA